MRESVHFLVPEQNHAGDCATLTHAADPPSRVKKITRNPHSKMPGVSISTACMTYAIISVDSLPLPVKCEVETDE